MNDIKTIVSTSLIAGTLALTGCGDKQKPEVTMIETVQKCSDILYGLAQNCTANAEVRGVRLNGTSNYLIAGKSGKENDTGKLKDSNVENNVNGAIKTIEESIEEQIDKSSWKRTDIKVSRKSITLYGNAYGTASYIGNMESGKYTPGFGALDSARSEISIRENKVNAKARCDDTINSIGENIAPHVINTVNCKGEIIPFSNEEIDILLSVGGWLLEYKEEFRGKNISPAIVAFSYIKGIESGKNKNEINNPTFKSNLDKAIEIVKRKHYVVIDGVEANVLLEINKNEITDLGIGTLAGGVLGGLSIAGFLAFLRRRKNKQ